MLEIIVGSGKMSWLWDIPEQELFSRKNRYLNFLFLGRKENFRLWFNSYYFAVLVSIKKDCRQPQENTGPSFPPK